MSKIFENINLNLLEQKGIQASILIAIVLIVNLTLRLILRKVQHRKDGVSLSWIKVFIEAVDRPLRLYLWIVVVAYVFYWIFEILFKHDFVFFVEGELLATLGVIVWAIFRLIVNIENFYIDRLPASSTISFEISGIKAVSRMAQIGLLFFAVLMVLAILNIPLSGLLTFGGVGGIAVAYAGKGVLTNFFGGVMVYCNRQFSVGDLIASPDRNIEGTVERIDWRYTTIRIPNKQILYIPNGIFIDIIVINRSRMSHRKIEQTIRVRYDDVAKVPLIFQDVRDFLNQYSEIDPDAGVSVHLTELASSSVNFTIAVYTKTVQSEMSNQIQDVILLKAFEIIQAHGADCPTTLLLPAQAGTVPILPPSKIKTFKTQ